MKEIQDTSELVCPHCNFVFLDTVNKDLDENLENEVMCTNCGKEFIAIVNITVTYSSFIK